MDAHPDYIEPTRAGRIKIAAAVLVSVAVFQAIKRWLIPAFNAHVHALPRCEQWHWLMNTVHVVFWAVPLLLTIVMVPVALRLIRHRQFPLPGAWVWQRTKIQRGRVVVLRAYALLAACLLAWGVSFWAVRVLSPLNAPQSCDAVGGGQLP